MKHLLVIAQRADELTAVRADRDRLAAEVERLKARQQEPDAFYAATQGYTESRKDPT